MVLELEKTFCHCGLLNSKWLYRVEFSSWSIVDFKWFEIVCWCSDNLSGFFQIGAISGDRPSMEIQNESDVTLFLLKWG